MDLLQNQGFHSQPPSVKTGNSTANGIVNGAIKPQMRKAIDMRVCWSKDRAEQGQFKNCWAAGNENWAESFTKCDAP